ncbi:hypothetical protein DBR32_04350 [Taibaiella sp. KBW10]|uniref:oligosaccharide flippase family protein n=1 Tax=Taibaiella sp. KBW10 TaxID=2153357 RepID=UPI000F5A153D|nr:oligosaccharide flippase family protein [Taibaiella sp. KBW10]RQO31206.1 hypothetical protein DBR32_04350 [Taibaiella sp. KBW10]
MRKHFVQNLLFLLLVNLIVKPLWIMGIDRTVQNTVGNAVYGSYFAILNFTIIFQVLLDFGLQNYNNQVVSKAPQAMRNLFPNIIIAKLILSFIYVAIIIGLGTLWGYTTSHFLLLITLTLVQITSSFLLFFRSNIAALQYFKTDSIFSVLDRFLVIGIVAGLLFLPQIRHHFTIQHFALAQLGAFIVAAVAGFLTCRKLSKLHWHHIKLKKVRLVLKQSIPYALLIFLMSIYMRSDVILLEKLATDGTLAGKYAAAFRLLDVCNNMSGVLFAGMLLPLLGKMIAKKEDYRSIIKLSANILIPASWGIFILIFFWGDFIFLKLYKEVSTSDTAILRWLMLCLPLYAINYIYSTLLTANGNIKTLVRISFLAVLINVGLNLYGIYTSGANAGIVTARNAFITLLFVSACNIWFSAQTMHLQFDRKWILRHLLFLICSSLGAYAIAHFMNTFPAIAQMGFTLFMALCLYLLLGIISLKDLKTPLKKFSSPHN